MGEVLSQKELVYLLGLPPGSRETYRVMTEAAHLSRRLTDGTAALSEIVRRFKLNYKEIINTVIRARGSV